jgi:hypothetical protein
MKEGMNSVLEKKFFTLNENSKANIINDFLFYLGRHFF